MEELLARFPAEPPLTRVHDTLKEVFFDPQQCGIYSGNFRFCFRTKRDREFHTELNVCLRKHSYWDAINAHRMPRLQEAFRNAIADQIHLAKSKYFEKEAIRICPYTQEAFSFQTCHVDHGGPTSFLNGIPFDKLMQLFIKRQADISDQKFSAYAEKQVPARVKEFSRNILISHQPPYELIDKKLREGWQEFHQVHAHLHVVSRRANLFLQDMKDMKDTSKKRKTIS